MGGIESSSGENISTKEGTQIEKKDEGALYNAGRAERGRQKKAAEVRALNESMKSLFTELFDDKIDNNPELASSVRSAIEAYFSENTKDRFDGINVKNGEVLIQMKKARSETRLEFTLSDIFEYVDLSVEELMPYLNSKIKQKVTEQTKDVTSIEGNDLVKADFALQELAGMSEAQVDEVVGRYKLPPSFVADLAKLADDYKKGNTGAPTQNKDGKMIFSFAAGKGAIEAVEVARHWVNAHQKLSAAIKGVEGVDMQRVYYAIDQNWPATMNFIRQEMILPLNTNVSGLKSAMLAELQSGPKE